MPISLVSLLHIQESLGTNAGVDSSCRVSHAGSKRLDAGTRGVQETLEEVWDRVWKSNVGVITIPNYPLRCSEITICDIGDYLILLL